MKWFEFMFPVYFSPDDSGNGGGSGDSQGDGNSGGATATIDWSKVDPASIPADLLKKTPAYTNLLDENVKRRQTNTELKKQFDDLSRKLNPEGNEEGTTPVTNNTNNTGLSPDVAAYFEKLTQSIESVNQRLEKQDAETLTGWRSAAAEKYGIKSEFVRDNLQGKNQAEVFANAEKIATDLGIALPQDSSNVGNPNNQNNAAFRARVQSYMDGASSNDPYNTAFQRASGGGVIDPNGN